MTNWQPIESAPKDGTVIQTIHKSDGRFWEISYLSAISSRFLNGEWCANFGTKDDEDWKRYSPQPTHWVPI